MNGRSGFNVLAANGAVHFEVRRPKSEPPSSSAALDVYLNGRPVESGRIIRDRARLRYEWTVVEMVYVELRARRIEDGDSPARLTVIPRR